MRRLLPILALTSCLLAAVASADEASPSASPPESTTSPAPSLAFFGVAPSRTGPQLQQALLELLRGSGALTVIDPQQLDSMIGVGEDARQEVVTSGSPEFHLPTYAAKVGAQYAAVVLLHGDEYELHLYRLPSASERLRVKIDAEDAASQSAAVDQVVAVVRSESAAATTGTTTEEPTPSPVAVALIQHTAPTTATADQPLVLRATIQCARKFTATVHFRRASATSWLETSMLLKQGHEYVASLGPFGEGEIEYFIWVSSDDDNLDKLGTAGSETEPYRVRLEAKTSPATVEALTAPRPKATKPPLPGYLTLGAAVIAAGVGTYFGLQTRSDGVQSFTTLDAGTWQSARTHAVSNSHAATAAWCTAGALGVAGTLLLAFHVTF